MNAETVDLVRFPRGLVWHIPTADGCEDEQAQALCGRGHGRYENFERGLDPKVVSLAGRPVCPDCRRLHRRRA